MIIGVPREIKPQEARVALVPAAAAHLGKRGHQVIVECGAGEGAGYPDEEYERAGAEIVETHEEPFARADLVVKVKEPLPQEFPLLRPGLILFTYLHLAADRRLTEALLASGTTGVAYETVQVGRRLPLLEPMSEIAGKMSVIVGAHLLARPHGGRGVLLGGVPGVMPARVVVLGGGTSGVNAARMAAGLGADVVILELDVERMRFLDLTLPGIRTLYSNEANLADQLRGAHLVVGAVLLPGAKAPRLINRGMLRSMKSRTVFVDIAIDQGGCAETSRPTTHEDPIFTEENIVHYCVTNMPGAYARTATQALNNVTNPFLELIARHGLADACKQQPALLGGINTIDGNVTQQAVAEAHQLPYEPPERFL